jgi:hypothetical protein
MVVGTSRKPGFPTGTIPIQVLRINMVSRLMVAGNWIIITAYSAISIRMPYSGLPPLACL